MILGEEAIAATREKNIIVIKRYNYLAQKNQKAKKKEMEGDDFMLTPILGHYHMGQFQTHFIAQHNK